jgi:hypothetical protein
MDRLHDERVWMFLISATVQEIGGGGCLLIIGIYIDVFLLYFQICFSKEKQP